MSATTERAPREQRSGAGLPQRAVTVLLADDRAPVRMGTRLALEHHGFSVVAEASDADQAVALALVHEPEVCLIELDLPGDGAIAARDIRSESPGTKVAMLTASTADGDVVRALRAGANGYMLKNVAPDRLATAVRALARGEVVLPRALTAALVVELRKQAPSGSAGLGERIGGRVFYLPRLLRHYAHYRRAHLPRRSSWVAARARMSSRQPYYGRSYGY